MPLFGASSDKIFNYRARLEHKMCVAKETPEPIFDLSECDLNEVPSGVVSMCRVFRKEVLDLRANKLSKLPDDIGLLTNLKVLNLQDNRLKKLPSAMKNMAALQVLNLKRNKFSTFPSVICDIPCLQALYLNGNDKLKLLPKELCEISTLRTVELDADNFTYPPPEICKEGTEAIMKFFCAESRKEYPLSPSTDQCDSDSQVDSSVWDLQQMNSSIPATFDLYQRAKEQRHLKLVKMEEEMYDKQQIQAQVAVDIQLRRQKLLEDVAEEQERMEGEMLQLQSKKEKEKLRLLSTLYSLEDDSAKLIEQLREINERSKNKDVLLDLMEKDRRDVEELFSLKQEELENLRKKEVLYAMDEMLKNEERQRLYEAGRQNLAKELNEVGGSAVDSDMIQNLLSEHERDQQALIQNLLEEEKYQKQAFEVLQLQRDQRHAEITQQITLIEQELTKLTTAELKRKDLRLNLEVNVLAERRSELAMLLANLLNERSKREKELQKRICDMDERREEEMKDFWLIQYQRLMDRKPQKIVELEQTLDPSIITILSEAGAQSYIPLFAEKQITLSMLLKMETTDLKKVGIINGDICKNIMKVASGYSDLKQVDIEPERCIPSAPEEIQPSAPSADDTEEPSTTMISSKVEIRMWCQTECVVCMDTESQVVFLPCGHVCCCWTCAEPLSSCPLCRADVQSRFLLTISGNNSSNINL